MWEESIDPNVEILRHACGSRIMCLFILVCTNLMTDRDSIELVPEKRAWQAPMAAGRTQLGIGRLWRLSPPRRWAGSAPWRCCAQERSAGGARI